MADNSSSGRDCCSKQAPLACLTFRLRKVSGLLSVDSFSETPSKPLPTPSRRLRSSRCDGWKFETLSSQRTPLWYGYVFPYPCHWLPHVGFPWLYIPLKTWRNGCRKVLFIEVFIQQVNSVVGIVRILLSGKLAADRAHGYIKTQKGTLARTLVSPGRLLESVLGKRVLSPVQFR